MFSETIMKNEIDEKRHLSKNVSRRKENITKLERNRRRHLIFSKIVRKNE